MQSKMEGSKYYEEKEMKLASTSPLKSIDKSQLPHTYYGIFSHMCKFGGCTCREWTQSKIDYVLGQRDERFEAKFAGLEKYKCLTPGREGKIILVQNWEHNKELICGSCYVDVSLNEAVQGTIIKDFHYITTKDEPSKYECYQCKKMVLLQRRSAHLCEVCCLEFFHHERDIQDCEVWGVLDRVGILTHTEDSDDSPSDEYINYEDNVNQDEEAQQDTGPLVVPGSSNEVIDNSQVLNDMDEVVIATSDVSDEEDQNQDTESNGLIKTTRECGYCHQQGHHIDDCFWKFQLQNHRPEEFAVAGSSNPQRPCIYCHRRGHTSNHCPASLRVYLNNKTKQSSRKRNLNYRQPDGVVRKTAVDFLAAACRRSGMQPIYTAITSDYKNPLFKCRYTCFITPMHFEAVGEGPCMQAAKDAAAERMWRQYGQAIKENQWKKKHFPPCEHWGPEPEAPQGTKSWIRVHKYPASHSSTYRN